MRNLISIIEAAEQSSEANLLYESFAPSMHDFLNDDVVDEILRTGNWVDHGSEIEQWWDTAGYEMVDGPVSEMPYNEARNTPEFRKALWEVLRMMADQNDKALKSGSTYDGVARLDSSSDLWRVIWVNQAWAPKDGLAVGIYWSLKKGWESRFTQTDYSDGEMNRCILMKVHAGDTHIDWRETARSRFSYDHGLEEHEIQLTKGSPINQVMCWEFKNSKMHFLGTIAKGIV